LKRVVSSAIFIFAFFPEVSSVMREVAPFESQVIHIQSQVFIQKVIRGSCSITYDPGEYNEVVFIGKYL
jgi:hypothetical protein